MNTRHIHTNTGNTLIELVLYIGLIAIFISGAIRFSWDMILSSSKSMVQREVNQNLRLSTERISYEIRNAQSINSVTASELCLASQDIARNPTRIYVSGGRLRIAWGGGSINCTSMANDQPLTSNIVTVPSLTFTNLSSGSSSYNIYYQITVSSTGVREEWQKTASYASTVELRSN